LKRSIKNRELFVNRSKPLYKEGDAVKFLYYVKRGTFIEYGRNSQGQLKHDKGSIIGL